MLRCRSAVPSHAMAVGVLVAIAGSAWAASASGQARNPFDDGPRSGNPSAPAADNPFGASPPQRSPAFESLEADPAACLDALFEEVFPDKGEARPPYLPARYDLALKKPDEEGVDMEELRRRAVERQAGTEQLWSKVQDWLPEKVTPEVLARQKMVRYAFGEGRLKEAVAAARRAGPSYRFAMARLLLAECRFDEAVRELASLADEVARRDGYGSFSDRALALLVRHQAEREELGQRVTVVPLQFDLDAYLKRRSRDPHTRLFIEGLRRAVSASEGEETAVEGILEVEEVAESLEPLSSEPSRWGAVADPIGLIADLRDLELRDTSRAHLVTSGAELALYPAEHDWIGAEPTTFVLHSSFGGPVRLQLHRLGSSEQGAGADPESGARGARRQPAPGPSRGPIRTWSEEVFPLKENNRTASRTRAVVLRDLEDGRYLLLAEARYAPMAAACEFEVCNVALYLRAGPNRAVIVAVNRRNGRPVPDAPVSLAMTGTPDPYKVVSQLRQQSELFRAGFRGDGFSDRRGPPAKDTVEQVEKAQRYVERLQDYVRGAAARRGYPDPRWAAELRTGRNGGAATDLPPARADYDYRLSARLPGQGQEKTAVEAVHIDRPKPPEAPWGRRAVVWLDEPIKRPGDTVRFQGIVRRTLAGRVADSPPEGGDVPVRVRNYYHNDTLWEGRCKLSQAGTFQGSFPIPKTARLGGASFYVDSTVAEPRHALVVTEYRLPAVAVELEPSCPTVAAGEPIEGSVTVRDASGMPAAGAKVEVFLETRDKKPPTALVETGEDGAAPYSLPAPLQQRDRSLRLHATATALSGQTGSDSARVRVASTAFAVRVVPGTTAAIAGEPFAVSVTAAEWDGRAIEGAVVAIDAARRAAITDHNGVAGLVATLDRSSQIEVTVVAGERVVRATATVQFAPPQVDAKKDGQGPAAKGQAPRGPFSVAGWEIPERIDAGETFQFSVDVRGVPGRQYTMAAFLENDLLRDHQVRCVEPGKHRLTFKTEREWGPSVQVAVALMDGHAAQTSTRQVLLRPVEKMLALTVQTDKAEYRPGAPCRAVVTARDHQGRPVPGAEISLGVVDEAIYLALPDPTPDLFDFFHQQAVPSLCRDRFDARPPPIKSRWLWLGPRYAWGYYPEVNSRLGRRRVLIAYGGGAMASGRRADVRIRRRFETAAHWVAQLRTDDRGQARVDFTLPDSLTSWRFTARGVTADTLVGEVREVRATQLPLGVDMSIPRGFRAGDAIQLPVLVRNDTDEARRVEGVFRLADGKEKPLESLKLAAGAAGRWTVPVTAEEARPLKLFAAASDAQGEHRDAMEKTLAPLPRGTRVVRDYPGSLDRRTEVRLDLVEGLAQPVHVSIRREPGLAGPVASAMDELIQYPYGCVEQTMSRFMPAVVAAEAMQRAGIRCPAAQRLPDVLRKGLNRLAQMQHDDGGWGWWSQDETNPFMTAYVVEGLALCSQAGPRVAGETAFGPADRERTLRAVAHPQSRLTQGDLQGAAPGPLQSVSLPVFAAHALAAWYATDAKRHEEEIAGLRQCIRRRGLEGPGKAAAHLTPLDRVLLADTMRLLGDRADRGTALWGGPRGTLPSPKRGDRKSIVLAANALRVGAAVAPDDPRWPRLARRLVDARSGSGWGDTLTTAAAVRGLASTIGSQRQESVPVAVFLDGRKVGQLPTELGSALEAKLDGPKRAVIVPECGGSPDFFVVRVEGHLSEPAPPPVNPMASVRTRVFRLRPEWAELKADGSGKLSAPLGEPLEVVVELTLRRPIAHALLTVPRPCGVEMIRGPDRGGQIVATEERDDALHFFAAKWSEGTHRFSFLVRAEVAGTVSVPPPQLVPMYDDPLPTAADYPSCWVVGPWPSAPREL